MALFLPFKGWTVVKGLKWVFTYLYIYRCCCVRAMWVFCFVRISLKKMKC